MRPIGGELALKSSGDKIYFTDSGRSSLRLFLRSDGNREKKYLLPDFFCEVIENIFIEEETTYQFYTVFDDLTIDSEFINKQEYDGIYIINYFGKYTDLSKVNLEDKILIEDNVFLYDFHNHAKSEKWYAFNSFRKISLLADGSLAKTNMPIDDKKILREKALFPSHKYAAKYIKYSFISNGEFRESDYLDRFKEGEYLLDKQKNIYRISDESIFLLYSQKPKWAIRESRFHKLKSIFGKYTILDSVDCYSFFVLHMDKRDALKKELMQNNIFLPVHWPRSTRDHNLYESIISIPLFENYSDKEFDILITSIKEFYEKL